MEHAFSYRLTQEKGLFRCSTMNQESKPKENHITLLGNDINSYCKERYGKNSKLKLITWITTRILYWFILAIVKNRESNQTHCDVLLLHPSRKSKALGRKKALIDKLKEKGLSVNEDILADEKEIVKNRLYRCSKEDKYYLRIYDGYSRYLKYKYKPKVIITERNGNITSSFLKCRKKGDSVTVHLSHSILTSQSSRFNYIDYDFYCIYGKSSLEYLKSIELYGECEIFFGGSYLFDDSFELPPNPNAPILLLGAGPDIEKTESCIEIYKIVKKWQEKSNETLYIRLHPRSQGVFWEENQSEKIIILRNESFVDSAKRCSIMLSPYTNAVIDAALLNRPVQLLKCEDEIDFLKVESFFSEAVASVNSLELAIKNIRSNFDQNIIYCREFADYHIANGKNSVNMISDKIFSLCQGSNNNSQ